MIQERKFSLRELDISLEDIYFAMGYIGVQPDASVTSVVDEVLSEVKEIAGPEYMYRLVPAEKVSKTKVELDRSQFNVAGIIGSYLDGMTHACVFVATAGTGYDAYLHELKHQGDILKEFVADSIGTVIAESCVSALSDEISRVTPLKKSLPYSPGYCAWDIREQKILFSLFPSNPCGITLSDSSLMSPIKSVSGFFGLGEELVPQPYRCGICPNDKCYKKKRLR